MTMTHKILAWMIAGLIIGVLINTTAGDNDFIQTYFTEGLFNVVGGWFINALKMLVVPLVTFSLISGVCNIGDLGLLGRVGSKAFVLFIVTTALAITLAICVTTVTGPGQEFVMTDGTQNSFTAPEAPPLTQVLINLIPGNPIAAFANGNMLQIIFFSILFAVCVIMLDERGKPIAAASDRLNDVMMKLVELVMQVAPYGIFALMAKTFAVQGPELILPMAGYFGTVVLVLFLHVGLTLPLLLKLLSKLNPLTFMKKLRTMQVFAFSTSSSNATIPVTLRTCENRLGVDNATASFVVPLGATINMDGTAIMQGVATVFIANVYGFDLNLGAYLTVIVMAVLASIGTAGVPGVGLIMLAMVFNQVGLPVEGIALIMGVDRLLDMMRTAVNVTGDATITAIVARSEDKLDMSVFNDPDAGSISEIHLHPRTNANVD
jgi:Na+/H+-dicarboxylate symporter